MEYQNDGFVQVDTFYDNSTKLPDIFGNPSSGFNEFNIIEENELTKMSVLKNQNMKAVPGKQIFFPTIGKSRRRKKKVKKRMKKKYKPYSQKNKRILPLLSINSRGKNSSYATQQSTQNQFCDFGRLGGWDRHSPENDLKTGKRAKKNPTQGNGQKRKLSSEIKSVLFNQSKEKRKRKKKNKKNRIVITYKNSSGKGSRKKLKRGSFLKRMMGNVNFGGNRTLIRILDIVREVKGLKKSKSRRKYTTTRIHTFQEECNY